ncbi:MAG: hypothetical protein ACOYNZ_01335 [Rhodoferax sp.]
MTKFGEDPSSLFRSLRPDDASFQASTVAAAREAELRWPLFKTLSPKKAEPTPALSAEERRHWSVQERPSSEERKPVLSVPGVSNKLAKSLSKMALRPAPAVAEKPVKPPHRSMPASESVRSSPSLTQNTPERDRSPLFAETVASRASEDIEEHSEEPLRMSNAQRSTAETDMAAPVSSATSLASLFKRLEGEEKVDAKPVRRKSSFLGRLGKR